MEEGSQNITNIINESSLISESSSLPNIVDQQQKNNKKASAAKLEEENDYHFPPKYPWKESTIISIQNIGKYVMTPFGFCITIYGLNIVGWGGMMFLLLCNAAPAMCQPSCEDINSSRRKWIEIDSQILNGLFCVTGFGTIPWRFRDLWYLMQYRILKKDIGLKKLSAINKNWFRMSSTIIQDGDNTTATTATTQIFDAQDSIPLKKLRFLSPNATATTKALNPPLTGIYAPPTPTWKLDFVIWTMIWNTLFQTVLSGLMWGLNRYERPAWSTGLFITLGCIVGSMGGLMIFLETKKVKSIEGIQVTKRDLEILARDEELGIIHYNNIKDKKPKEKK